MGSQYQQITEAIREMKALHERDTLPVLREISDGLAQIREVLRVMASMMVEGWPYWEDDNEGDEEE